MIRIKPLGTDIILPAFVIGYEHHTEQIVNHFEEHPAWLTVLDQQTGGMLMSYPSVVGAVLRLEKNLDRALSADVLNLIQGFKYMAEDPKVELLNRDYPVLRRLVSTRGKDYTSKELQTLTEYISSYIRIPRLKSGLEAFVRFEKCDPLDFFQGWHIMVASHKPDVESVEIYTIDDKSYYVDESNLHTIRLEEPFQYSKDIQMKLSEFGNFPGEHEYPNVYLLWENCD